MPTITLDGRSVEVRTMTRGMQQDTAEELAWRAVARSREGMRWKALKNVLRLALVVFFATGCATTYRPTTFQPGAFSFTLTPEQCLSLNKERRTYRATEKTAGYVAGAGALVSVLALGFVDAKAVPAFASGVSLLAGGTLAFTGPQIQGLDDELRDGGCSR